MMAGVGRAGWTEASSGKEALERGDMELLIHNSFGAVRA